MFLILLWMQLLYAKFSCQTIWIGLNEKEAAPFFEVDPSFNERYFIGILVKIKEGQDEQEVLAVSSYSASMHFEIDKILQTQFPGKIKEILWGGELKMQRSAQGKSVFVKANETSSHIGKLAPNQSVEHLERWLIKHEPQMISSNFKTEKYDPKNKNLHLNEIENTFTQEFPMGVRHEIISIRTIVEGQSLMIDQDISRLKSAVTPEQKNEITTQMDKFLQRFLRFDTKLHPNIFKHYYRELLVDGFIKPQEYQVVTTLMSKVENSNYKMSIEEYQKWISVYREVEKRIKERNPTLIFRPTS